ncbi:MAG: hypothetical protein QM790_00885 [Nibricoccus sp.]
MMTLNKAPTHETPSSRGPLTREKVRERARTLAANEGRTPANVSQSDYEQAKRELTGLSGLAQQEALLDLLPEVTLLDVSVSAKD